MGIENLACDHVDDDRLYFNDLLNFVRPLIIGEYMIQCLLHVI